MKVNKLLTCILALAVAASVVHGLEYVEKYHYDALGRLSAVTVEGHPQMNQAYRYDASGNLVEKTIGGRSVTMAYDRANQLVSRTDATGVTHFDYDGAGRMIRERRGGDTLAEYEYGYLDKVAAAM